VKISEKQSRFFWSWRLPSWKCSRLQNWRFTMSTPSQLQFAPFSSALDAGFWHSLSQNKLDVYKLDETTHPVHGFFYNGDPPGLPCRMNIDYTAFEEWVLNLNFDLSCTFSLSLVLLWQLHITGMGLHDCMQGPTQNMSAYVRMYSLIHLFHCQV
jgi:hypothetical protein